MENAGEMRPMVVRLKDSAEKEDNENGGFYRNFMTNSSEYS